MEFLIHILISVFSLLLIVFSCYLFTNAIEVLGNRLKLGNCATGSILAVIGTGLPETIIPIVAIMGANFSDLKMELANDIALGAIVGSPFMLSTLALFLLGVVLFIKKRNELNLNYNFVLRDYKYLIIAYLIAIFLPFKILTICLLIFIYGIFVYRTIVKSKCVCMECDCEELYFSRIKMNYNFILFLQLIFSLTILFSSSYFFVNEIKFFSNILGITPLLLAFIVTPFATELPEIINSIIWLKQGKDELAIANVVGAVVFQTTLLFALGHILISWEINNMLILNAILFLICTIFFAFLIFFGKKIKIQYLLVCGIFYFAYIFYIVLK